MKVPLSKKILAHFTTVAYFTTVVLQNSLPVIPPLSGPSFF